MGQNKLESEFRKKLNEREINPTPQAWDRLDAMLTVGEEKKSDKSYKWLYIAAGFLGFLLMATMFFRQGANSDQTENGVAIENNQNKNNPTDSLPKQLSPTKTPAQEAVAGTPSVEKHEVPATLEKKQPVKRLFPETKIKNDNQVADHSEINKPERIQNDVPKPNTVISLKPNVDELLASAEPTIKENSKKQSIKVDANALLSQVDGELELSFREKVINTVSKNYKTVKVALANRNQE